MYTKDELLSLLHEIEKLQRKVIDATEEKRGSNDSLAFHFDCGQAYAYDTVMVMMERLYNTR